MKNKYRAAIMERRSSKRYSVTEGVYAAFKSNRQLVGPVEIYGGWSVFQISCR